MSEKVRIELGLDGAEETEAKYADIERALTEMAGALARFAAASEDAGDASDDLDEALDDAGEAAEESRGAFARLSDGLRDAGNRMRSAAGDIFKSMREARFDVDRQGKLMLAGMGAAGAGFAYFAANAAKEMDAGMAIIRRGTGATGAALEELGAISRSVYRQVPVDMAAVSTAVADLNTRLGLAGEPLERMSRQYLELANMLGSDVAPVIADTTRTMGDWSVAAEDQAGKMDYLYRVAQTTGIEWSRLNQLMVQYGAPLRTIGYDFESSAAMIGKWEREGVNVELVFSGLRQAISKFSREGKDLAPSLASVFEQIQKLGQKEGNLLAMSVFGSEAGVDFAAAIREGRFEVAGLVDELGRGGDGIIAAAEEGRTAAERWRISLNKLSESSIGLGEMILSGISFGVDGASPLIEDAVAYWSGLLENAAGGDVVAVATIVDENGIEREVTWLEGTFDEIWRTADSAWDKIVGSTEPYLDTLNGVAAALGRVRDWFAGGSLGIWAADSLESARTAVGDFVDGAIERLGGLAEQGGEAMSDLAGGITSGLGGLPDAAAAKLGEMAEAARGVLSGLASDAGALAGAMMDAIRASMAGKVQGIVNVVKSMAQQALGWIDWLWEKSERHSVIPDMLDAWRARFDGLGDIMVRPVRESAASALAELESYREMSSALLALPEAVPEPVRPAPGKMSQYDRDRADYDAYRDEVRTVSALNDMMARAREDSLGGYAAHVAGLRRRHADELGEFDRYYSALDARQRSLVDQYGWREELERGHLGRLGEIAGQGLASEWDARLGDEERRYQAQLDAFSEYADAKGLLMSERNAWEIEMARAHDEEMARIGSETWASLLGVNEETATAIMGAYDSMGQGLTDTMADAFGAMIMGAETSSARLDQALGSMLGGILGQFGSFLVSQGMGHVAYGFGQLAMTGGAKGHAEVAAGSKEIVTGGLLKIAASAFSGSHSSLSGSGGSGGGNVGGGDYAGGGGGPDYAGGTDTGANAHTYRVKVEGLDGIDPDQFFSGKTVRQLIENMAGDYDEGSAQNPFRD